MFATVSLRILLFGFRLTPYWLLYAYSNAAYLLLYHLIGYRKKVVRANIVRSFPEKSEAERRKIERDFYRYLCDNLLEGLKGMVASEKSLRQRYAIQNPEVLAPYFQANRDVILVGGHYLNWEWSIILPGQLQHDLCIMYKPVKNKAIDALLLKSRSRFGVELRSSKDRSAMRRVDNERPAAFYLLADQNPSNSKTAFWVPFLQQDTPTFRGPELYAKRLDAAVFYYHIRSSQRGHYEITLEKITDVPKETAKGSITYSFMKHLERDIQAHPATWLWSHKRWKHQREADQPLINEV